jgi:hypothetical protein
LPFKRESLFQNRELRERWETSDEDFQHWQASLKSPDTKKNYFESCTRIYRAMRLNPKDIVAAYKADGDTRKKFLDDFEMHLNKLMEKGTYGTARNEWEAVVSLLKHRKLIREAKDFEIERPESEIITPKHTPKQEEFETMLRYAGSARNRFIVGFHRYQGGRRGISDDPEPMKLRHILDLDFEALKQKQVKFKQKSSCAVAIYAGFKDGKIVRYKDTYVGFMVPSVMQLLQEYLEERLRNGEKLTPDSYLLLHDRMAPNRKYDYVPSEHVTRVVSQASIAAGYVNEDGSAKFTAQSLRRLFYNSLSGIDEVEKEALQGHIQGIKAFYHGSVDDLPRVVEFMRSKYELAMRAYIGGIKEEVAKQVILETARQQGVSEEKLAKMRQILLEVTVDQLREMADREIDHVKKRRHSKPTATDGGKRPYEALLISEDQLVEHMSMGWEVVKELSNGKVAIRRAT